MLIYLDTCCLNRPFDDQNQLVIRLQTEAKLHIQHAIRQGELSLVWSAAMDLENEANPDVDRRDAIAGWKPVASMDVDLLPEVESTAEELARNGMKPMDALHVASALSAKAAWLLTTDRGLLGKMKGDPRIQVADPVDFVRATHEGGHEN